MAWRNYKTCSLFTSRCLPNCTCIGLVQDCTGKVTCNVTLKDKTASINNMNLTIRVFDISSNSHWFHSFDWENSPFSKYLERLNISSCEITILPQKFFRLLASLKVLDLSYNALRHLRKGLFKYLSNLRLLRLDGNTAILDIDSESFSGLSSLESLKIGYLHVGRISRKAFSGLKLGTFQFYYTVIDYIEENAFSELSVNRVYLNSSRIVASSDLLFEGIRNLTYIKTYSYRFCCLLPSYLTKTKCIPKPDTTTMCHNLLGKEKYILWIAGIVSSFASFLSFRSHFSFDRTSLGFGHNFFLLNLAASDFLMGVYDIIITGSDIAFSGVYASMRYDWLKGWLCHFATIISLISVLASSFFVCLIAVGRFLVIKFPSGEFQFHKKLSLSIVFLVWLFAVCVSTAPILYTTLFKNEVYSHLGVCFGLRLDSDSSLESIFSIGVLMCLAMTIFVIIIMGHWYIDIERKETKANRIRIRQMRAADLSTSRNILVLVTINAVCLLVTAILGK